MTAPVGVVDTPAIAGLVVAGVVLWVVLYVWLALALSMVFRKAGVDTWRAWVPILNLFTLLELARYPGWIALAALVPFGGVVVWVFVVLAAHRVNRGFGYGAGMTVLAALALPVWASVLGFGPARWLGWMPGHRSTPSPSSAGPFVRRRPRDEDAAAPLLAAPPRVVPPLPTALAATVALRRAAAVPGGGAVPPGPLSTASPEPAPVSAAAWAPAAAAPVSAVTWAPAAVPWAPMGPRPDAPTPASSATPAPAEDGSRRSRRDQATLSAAPAASPITAVPTAEPDSPPPAALAGESPALHRPRYSPWTPDERDDLPDEISAVHTIPGIGAPRSARSAVSAQHTRSEIPDDEQTVVVVRRRAPWELLLPLGPPVPIAGRCVILGRRPAPDPDFADAQLVPIVDETRTVSKRHARLELQDDGWWIVDLDSTNGVVLVSADGAEHELEPGVPRPAGERFLLGDAEVRIQRGPGA